MIRLETTRKQLASNFITTTIQIENESTTTISLLPLVELISQMINQNKKEVI